MDRLDEIDFLCGCVQLRLGCLIISYIHMALSAMGLVAGAIMLNRGANVFMGTTGDIEITSRFGDDFEGRTSQGSAQTSIASLIMFVCVIFIPFAIVLIIGILKKNALFIKFHIISKLVLLTVLLILCSVWCFYDRFIYIAGFVVLVLFEFYSILVTQKYMREISYEKGRIYIPQPSAPPEPENQYLPRA